MDIEKELENLGYTFPERINMLLRIKDGVTSILFVKFKNKKINLKDIKFKDTKVFFWDGSSATSLGVFDFTSYKDLEEKTNELEKIWKTEGE